MYNRHNSASFVTWQVITIPNKYGCSNHTRTEIRLVPMRSTTFAKRYDFSAFQVSFLFGHWTNTFAGSETGVDTASVACVYCAVLLCHNSVLLQSPRERNDSFVEAAWRKRAILVAILPFGLFTLQPRAPLAKHHEILVASCVLLQSVLPRQHINPYRIKMEGEGYGSDDLRNFILASLSVARCSQVCVWCLAEFATESWCVFSFTMQLRRVIDDLILTIWR